MRDSENMTKSLPSALLQERTSGFSSRLFLLVALSAAASSCFDQATGPRFETDGRMSITNDDAMLGERVDYPNDVVAIDPDPASPVSGPASLSAPAGAGPMLAPSDIDLTLVAEITPPLVGLQLVQATSIWMTGSEKAIVSYNFRGLSAIGGLDYFTKLLNNRPQLRSSVAFLGTDVNAVFTNGSYAYAATSTSDLLFPFPAVMERIRIRNDRFSLLDAGNRRVALTSFAGTSLMATEDEVYVTTGNTGHITAYDEDDMTLRGQYALDDARWVSWDEPNNRVVVLQGMPGRLAVFQEGSFPGGSMTLLNTWSVPGVDVAESKNTVEVSGGKAYVAAGPAGVQVVCLSTGQVIGSVPIPNAASLGLSPSVVVTNSVTVDDDVMFISNGEAGVYAAAGSRDFDDSSCAPMTITVLGRLRFDNLESANHVVYRGGHLYVAAGLGGVKVVDVDVRN
ncbi:MAG: hypothetical protein ABL963_16665 [Longimicrobiales bacterium]